MNVPFPEKGATAADYLAAFHLLVLPILRAFAPELVLISAGFDAAEGDPLGGMLLPPSAFAEMTRMLMRAAGGGKVVAALEARFLRLSLLSLLGLCSPFPGPYGGASMLSAPA